MSRLSFLLHEGSTVGYSGFGLRRVGERVYVTNEAGHGVADFETATAAMRYVDEVHQARRMLDELDEAFRAVARRPPEGRAWKAARRVVS